MLASSRFILPSMTFIARSTMNLSKLNPINSRLKTVALPHVHQALPQTSPILLPPLPFSRSFSLSRFLPKGKAQWIPKNLQKKRKDQKKYKAKTHVGAKERFRILQNGQGLIKRWAGYRNHLMEKKSGRRRQQLKKVRYLEGRQARRIKKLLAPYKHKFRRYRLIDSLT